MMRKFGNYLLANNLRSALAALIFALLPMMMIPVGFLAAVIVGLVTLRKGVKAGLIVLAFVCLPAVSLLISKNFRLFEAYIMMVVQSTLVWTFCILLRNTRSWRWLLEIITILAALIIIAVHLFIPNVKAMWLQLMQQYFHSTEWASITRVTSLSPKELMSYAPIATGMLAFVSVLGVFLLIVLARWWEAVLVQPGLLRSEFIRIRIDWVAALLLLAATVALYWRFPWLIDLYPVLLFPFIIAGLSVLHSLVMWRKQVIFLIIAIYAAMLIGPVAKGIWLLLGLVGFIDSWYNIRKHYLT